MACIKTGFYAEIGPHGCWIYGDAYELGNVTYFRICHFDYRGDHRDRKHFTIRDYLNWFDQEKTSVWHNSTMMCLTADVINHGYDGVPIND